MERAIGSDEITVRQAAKQMEVDESTVYRYVLRGLIPGKKKGNNVFIKKTVPTKFKIAHQMPGKMPWYEKIQWTKEDLFDFEQREFKQSALDDFDRDFPASNHSSLSKAKELFAMAKRLKDLGEKTLFEQVVLRAAEVM